MRKIWVLILPLLIFLFGFNTAFAASNVVAAQEISPTPTPQINYELPYPGLLPDSPLYFLRATRDRIIGFLISDPLRKAEFNLLQADKRLNAGISLFNKGKIALALSTVSKAENYLEQALGKIGEAKTQGKDTSGIEKNLGKALKKHEQELGNLGFAKEQKRVRDFAERLNH